MCRYRYYYYAECQHQEVVLADFCASATSISGLPSQPATPDAFPLAGTPTHVAATYSSSALSLQSPTEIRLSLSPCSSSPPRPLHHEQSCPSILGHAQPSNLTISAQESASDFASLRHSQQQTDLRHQHHIQRPSLGADMGHMTGLTLSKSALQSLFQIRTATAQPGPTTASFTDVSESRSRHRSHPVRDLTDDSSHPFSSIGGSRCNADSYCDIDARHVSTYDKHLDYPQERAKMQPDSHNSPATLLQQENELGQKAENDVVRVKEFPRAHELGSRTDFPPLTANKVHSPLEDKAPKSTKQTSPRFAQPTKAFSVRAHETVCKESASRQAGLKKSPKRTSLPVDWAQIPSHGSEHSTPPKSQDPTRSTPPSYMSPTKATLRRSVAAPEQESARQIPPRMMTAIPRLKAALPQLKPRVRSPTTATSTSSHSLFEQIITEKSPGLYGSQQIFSRSAPVQVTVSAEMPTVPNTKPVRRDSHGSIILPIQQKLDKWGLLNSCSANLSTHASAAHPRSQELKSVLRAEAKEFTPLIQHEDNVAQMTVEDTDLMQSHQIFQTKPLSAITNLGRAPMPMLPQTPPTSVLSLNVSQSPPALSHEVSPALPATSPSTWSFTSSNGSNNDHWSGGDGREIKFIGDGARAERFFAHGPLKRQAQRASLQRLAVDGSNPRPVGPWYHYYFERQHSGFRPASPPLAPRSRRQWAQMLGSPQIPCDSVEFVQASEQGLYQPPAKDELKYWGHCRQCATTSQ